MSNDREIYKARLPRVTFQRHHKSLPQQHSPYGHGAATGGPSSGDALGAGSRLGSAARFAPSAALPVPSRPGPRVGCARCAEPDRSFPANTRGRPHLPPRGGDSWGRPQQHEGKRPPPDPEERGHGGGAALRIGALAGGSGHPMGQRRAAAMPRGPSFAPRGSTAAPPRRGRSGPRSAPLRLRPAPPRAPSASLPRSGPSPRPQQR